MNIPSLEDTNRAIRLAEMVVGYIDVDFDDDDEFTVRVSDEVFLHDGKLVDARCTGEGIVLCPSHNKWDLESIFDMIMYSIFEL